MTTEVSTALAPEKVERGLEWLRRLPALPPEKRPSVADVDRVVAAMTAPAAPEWIMLRAAATLEGYFDKDTPEAVKRMVADDWLEALRQFPAWAIDKSARWWKSADNPRRHAKPLEGDIAARCRVEMRGIDLLPGMMRSGALDFRPAPKDDRKPMSGEDAARVLAELGFDQPMRRMDTKGFDQ